MADFYLSNGQAFTFKNEKETWFKPYCECIVDRFKTINEPWIDLSVLYDHRALPLSHPHCESHCKTGALKGGWVLMVHQDLFGADKLLGLSLGHLQEAVLLPAQRAGRIQSGEGRMSALTGSLHSWVSDASLQCGQNSSGQANGHAPTPKHAVWWEMLAQKSQKIVTKYQQIRITENRLHRGRRVLVIGSFRFTLCCMNAQHPQKNAAGNTQVKEIWGSSKRIFVFAQTCWDGTWRAL